MDDNQRMVSLTDPSAMRALAHPTRLRLLGELRVRGPQTVGGLSELVDEAPGAVSYHLGKLSAHGFIEEAPELARNRRERWWRAATVRAMWEPVEVRDDPERGVSTDASRRAILRRYVETLESYMDFEPSRGRDQAVGPIAGEDVLWLTGDELAELRGEMEAVIARWRKLGETRKEGSNGVTVIYHAFRRG